ncbi:MAG TPA: hypothetical protein VFI02_02025 [Armatimonadota bacterium]|nr:hypothetical protein [Armatimonadota bacterium]
MRKNQLLVVIGLALALSSLAIQCNAGDGDAGKLLETRQSFRTGNLEIICSLTYQDLERLASGEILLLDSREALRERLLGFAGGTLGWVPPSLVADQHLAMGVVPRLSVTFELPENGDMREVAVDLVTDQERDQMKKYTSQSDLDCFVGTVNGSHTAISLGEWKERKGQGSQNMRPLQNGERRLSCSISNAPSDPRSEINWLTGQIMQLLSPVGNTSLQASKSPFPSSAFDLKTRELGSLSPEQSAWLESVYDRHRELYNPTASEATSPDGTVKVFVGDTQYIPENIPSWQSVKKGLVIRLEPAYSLRILTLRRLPADSARALIARQLTTSETQPEQEQPPIPPVYCQAQDSFGWRISYLKSLLSQ